MGCVQNKRCRWVQRTNPVLGFWTSTFHSRDSSAVVVRTNSPVAVAGSLFGDETEWRRSLYLPAGRAKPVTSKQTIPTDRLEPAS